MKRSIDEAAVTEVDDALTIHELFAGEDFAFSCVAADLDGDHPPVVNHESDRAYYVLSGTGTVTAGDEEHDVGQGDLVTIPAGTPHGVEGDLRYLVITAPPFDPANEEPA